MLSLTNGCDVSSWENILTIVKYIKEDKATIISKEWLNGNDRFPELYPLDLTELKTWSTYSRCVDIRCYTQGKKLICDTTIHDGDNFSGYPTRRRFTAIVGVPIKFIKYIKDDIECDFDEYMNDKYRQYLLTIKSKWITKSKQKIFDK